MALSRLGRPADADGALAEAERIDQLSDEPLLSAAIELERARIRHQAGDRSGARAAIRAAEKIVEHLPDPRFEGRLRAARNDVRFAAKAITNPTAGPELSDRELAVLELLPHRLPRRDLAAQLHVSENTLKTHLTSIRHKLGVSGRASIVDRARELGLLTEDA
jgi:LuxR family maltose regulon positive regulatory protein